MSLLPSSRRPLASGGSSMPDFAPGTFKNLSVQDVVKALPDKIKKDVGYTDDAPVPQRKPAQTAQNGTSGIGASEPDYRKGGSVRQSFDAGGSATPVIDGETGDQYHGSGLFKSLGAGRTDIHNRVVPPGGYVVPADVVSGLAEGNTMAGSAVIDRMMHAEPAGVKANTGPNGMKLDRTGRRGDFPRAAAVHAPRGINNDAEEQKRGGLAGGKKSRAHDTKPVPVVVAGGEHYISPEDIVAKFGDLDRGHKILDAWVVARREKNIKELKKLPGPKK